MAETGQTVLVTGAGGGIGRAVAAELTHRGWRVIAADRDPVDLPDCVGLVMDVTDSSAVDRAAAEVAERCPGGLQGVITLAGLLEIGPLAEMPDERLQRIVDVNVLGTHRTVRAMFGLLRAGQGRVILISSETGRQTAMPFNGAYTLTKHAIEAYGDALRRELALIGMPVSIVQPGPFKTAMTASIPELLARAGLPDSPFRGVAAWAGRIAAREHEHAADPRLLARVLADVMSAPKPRARYSVRPDRARAMFARLPIPVADAILRTALRGR